MLYRGYAATLPTYAADGDVYEHLGRDKTYVRVGGVWEEQAPPVPDPVVPLKEPQADAPVEEPPAAKPKRTRKKKEKE